MKTYPSIPTRANTREHITVFDKLDGSNIRAEWSRKQGFYKFGTRTRLVDNTDPILGCTPDLVVDKYGEDLDRIYRDNRFERAIAFFEFWGPNSFAGTHDLDSTSNTVTLFDVAPYKKGILPPRDFLNLVGDLDIPAVLHTGKINQSLTDSVRNSTLPGMTFEGVVCKYHCPKTRQAAMFKIKSKAWLDKLRDFVDGDEKAFKRLA